MGYSIEERETTLVYEEETKQWKVYSNVAKHIRKLLELGDMEIIEEEDGRPIAIRGVLAEKQVSMKKERIMSEEQRQKAADRMKKLHSQN